MMAGHAGSTLAEPRARRVLALGERLGAFELIGLALAVAGVGSATLRPSPGPAGPARPVVRA